MIGFLTSRLDTGRVPDGHRVQNELFGYLAVHAREHVAAHDAVDVRRRRVLPGGRWLRVARGVRRRLGRLALGVVGAARLVTTPRLDLALDFLFGARSLRLFAFAALRRRGVVRERRRWAVVNAGHRMLIKKIKPLTTDYTLFPTTLYQIRIQCFIS